MERKTKAGHVRRVIGIGLTMLLLVGFCFVTQAFAATNNTLIISANDVTAEAGDWVVISLCVEENPGFSAMLFYPSFQGEAKNWSWQASNSNTELLNEFGESFFTLSSYAQMMLDTQEADDCTATGVLLEIRVKIPEGTAPGAYTISFRLSQCINAAYQSVAVQLPTVTISVGCVHANTVMIDGKLPSCVDNGYTASVFCQDCKSYIIVSEPIAATGHSYGSVVTAPTCAADGYTKHTCASCGDWYTSDVVAKKDHVDEDKNHICDVCSNHVGEHSDSAEDKDHLCDYGCGATVEICVDATGDGDHSCDICGNESVTEHAYSNPKCDQPGACTECGVVTSHVLGHSEVVDAAVAATCTTPGLTEGRHCANCGALLLAQETIAALGHSEVVDAAVAATCTTAGLTEGKHCAACLEVFLQQQKIAPIGHNFGEWTVVRESTCTTGGEQSRYCEICNEAEIQQMDVNDVHSFGSWSVSKQATRKEAGEEICTCANCGEVKTRVIEPLGGVNPVIIIAAVAVVGIAALVIILLKKKK